jgi:hypothetical protein
MDRRKVQEEKWGVTREKLMEGDPSLFSALGWADSGSTSAWPTHDITAHIFIMHE